MNHKSNKLLEISCFFLCLFALDLDLDASPRSALSLMVSSYFFVVGIV
jgi:hypothetical protein